MNRICKVCKSEVRKNYCSNCGNPISLRRINGQYVFKEICSILYFEKGILFTIKELILRPGENIKTFIIEDRNRLVKPLFFIIITSLVYMLAQQILHVEDGYLVAKGFKDSSTTKIFEWIQNNYGYANILMAISIGGWIKLFFRKYGYNFFEILILLCFIMGIGMLIYTIFGILESTSKIGLLNIGGLVGVIYASWAIGQFFDKKKKSNYLKGFLSYFLGMLTFFLAMAAIGILVDTMHGN